MKTVNLILLTHFLLFSNLKAPTEKPNCAVLNINQVGVYNYSSEIIGNITRREFSKLGMYEILYAQDIKPLVEDGDNNPFECYSKQCLIESGKKIGASKMLSGQIEQMKDAKTTGKAAKKMTVSYLKNSNKGRMLVSLTLILFTIFKGF